MVDRKPLDERNEPAAAAANVSGAFCDEDEEITHSYLVWGGIALHYADLYLDLKEQRELQRFILEVVKSLFQVRSTSRRKFCCRKIQKSHRIESNRIDWIIFRT